MKQQQNQANVDATSAGRSNDDNYINSKLNLQGGATNGYEQLVASQVNSVSSKKGKIQLEKCEVCKIECTSKVMLNIHKQGKKHRKNLEKLKASRVLSPVPLVVPKFQEEPEMKNNVELKVKKVVDRGAREDAVKTCQVCSVVCNSEIVFQTHLRGKMHRKSLEKMEACRALGHLLVSSNSIISPQEKPKSTVDSGSMVEAVKASEVCNIVACDSKLVSQNHLDGEKPKKSLEKTEASLALVAPLVPNNLIADSQGKPEKAVESETMVHAEKASEVCNVVSISKPDSQNHLDDDEQKKILVKTEASLALVAPVVSNNPIIGPEEKMVESGTVVDAIKVCDVCNVEFCNELLFRRHLSGQRHTKRVLEAQKASLTPSPAPVAGSQENPNKRKARDGEPEDLESKKKKIIDGGTAVEAVRTCELCNVVCNSRVVFMSHLAGHKHFAMLKKGNDGSQGSITS